MLDLLEWGGHEVVCGRSGDEALERLESLPRLPDAIISDLTMPHMDGITLLRTVRANDRWSSVRFVMMSANLSDPRLTGEASALLDGLLPKPFDLEDLNRLLEK